MAEEWVVKFCLKEILWEQGVGAILQVKSSIVMNHVLLESRAAFDVLLSVQGVNIMGVVHALWGNAGKMGHTQRMNASQRILDLRDGAPLVHVPRRNGVHPYVTPLGGVHGDVEGAMKLIMASHDVVCLVTAVKQTSVHNVLLGRRHQLENASEEKVVSSLLGILLCDVHDFLFDVALSFLLERLATLQHCLKCVEF